MSLTKGLTSELKLLSDLGIIGAFKNELLSAFHARINKWFDSPIRMYAAATPDTKLYFASSKVEMGDESGRADINFADYDDADIVASNIDWQTGVKTGTSFTYKGAAFSFPTTTVGKVRAFVFSRIKNNEIAVLYSDEANDIASVTKLGAMVEDIEGHPIGFCFFSATAATAFKSVGALTSVIQHKTASGITVYNFGSSGSGGGGGDSSFKLSQVADGEVQIKKGKWTLSKGQILITGNVSTDVPINFSIQLADIIATPVANTLYWLCVDYAKLANTPTELTDTHQPVLQVYNASHFTLLAKNLRDIQKDRFMVVGSAYPVATNWVGCKVKTIPPRLHDALSAQIALTEPFSYQITSAVATHTQAHGLSGEPQSVLLFFYDASTTKKTALTLSDHLLDKTATNVVLSTAALTFDSGDYVEVQTFFTHDAPSSLLSSQYNFKSSWYTDTATTQVAHLLVDADEIASYEVQEWNTTTGKRRNIDRSGLVKEFDDTYIYFDWTGLTPSATLKYRVVTGNTAMPAALLMSRKNSYTFTDTSSLTEVTTAYPLTIDNDEITDIIIMQKMATDRWQRVTVPDTVFVEKASGIWYLRGDLSSLVPSGTNPVKVSVK